MPLIVAQLVRILIQAATQTGILLIATKLLTPLTDAAKRAVAKAFNMTDEEAEDTIANEIIDAFALIGIIGLSIKSKLPTKVAERLGFTSRGYVRRTPSKKLPAGASNQARANVSAARQGIAITSAEATAAVNTAKTAVSGFKIAYDFTFKFLGLGFLAALVIAQWIDFGNWNSGAYQKKMQKVLATITFGYLVPDEDYRKTKTASADVFSKVFNAYELEGAVGINDPFKQQSVLFTRDNMLDIVDQVGAGLLLSKGSASTKEVLAATQMMIVFKDAPTDVVAAPVTAGAVSTPSVKVFTGIISDGVLGAGLKFTPRPDDLIESMAELQTAINDNLAPFLVTLPGRIIYEVKVVSSIIDSQGLKRFGQAQTIQTGIDKLGNPKTKTIVNKWAVLYLYVLTDKGSRSKITTIVLGPTDAIKFRPNNSTLAAISQVIPQGAITLNTSDILSVVPSTPKPLTVENFAQAIGVPSERINQQTGEIIDPTPAEIAAFNYQFSTTPAPLPSVPRSQDTANTLFEWYAAQGQRLPSISARGQLYQSLGLGQASFYVGTAEQNTKLLNKLKEAPPPPPPIATAQPAPVVSGGTQTSAPFGFFRPPRGTPVFDRGSGSSLGLADGNTDYNSAVVRT